jgi:uncharacterized protein (DUF433 family)
MTSIIKHKEICGGQPTLKGTRLRVFDIVWGIFSDGLESYTVDHELSLQSIEHVINYCKELQCQDGVPGYCEGCIMSTLNGTAQINKEEVREIILPDKSTISIEGDNIFLGSKTELADARFGQIGWGIAEELYSKYLI